MPYYLQATSDWQTSEGKQNVWEILRVIYQVPLISILPTEAQAEIQIKVADWELVPFFVLTEKASR